MNAKTDISYYDMIVIVTIVLDLSFLCYFKYFNFVAENINGLFSLDIKFIEVIMPIGISFYTFQAMSYLLALFAISITDMDNGIFQIFHRAVPVRIEGKSHNIIVDLLYL